MCIEYDGGYFEKDIVDRDDEMTTHKLFFTSKTHFFTFARGRQVLFFSNTHISRQ